MTDAPGPQGSDRFLDKLVVEAALPTGWTLHTRLRYKTNIGPERTIQVPEGFSTDLASIPRLLRPLITKNGPSRYAAVVHDYLYRLAGTGPKAVPRTEADMIFREAMLDMEVPKWKMFLMHKGVQGLGFIAFNKRKKELNVDETDSER